MTIVRPGAAPALPPDALTMREDNGKAGYPSLLAVAVLAAIAAYLLTGYMHAIWACGLAGLGAYLVALGDRLLGINRLSRLAQEVVIVMMPPLALIFLVLGTIFVGIATPTEGGAMGATGALVMALAKRRLNWSLLRQAMDSTAKLSSFVIFILIGASVFTLTFRGVNGDLWVESLLTSLPGGQIGFLIVVNVDGLRAGVLSRLFRAGVHRHSAAASGGRQARHRSGLVRRAARRSTCRPLSCIRRSASRCSISAAWRRSANTIDRVTGRLVAPVTTAQIYWGSVPFVIMQLAMVAMVIAFPGMVLSSLDKGPKIDPSKIQIEVPQVVPSETPQIEIK